MSVQDGEVVYQMGEGTITIMPRPKIEAMIDAVEAAGFKEMDCDVSVGGDGNEFYWLVFERPNGKEHLTIQDNGRWDVYDLETGDELRADRGIESLRTFLTSIKEGL